MNISLCVIAYNEENYLPGLLRDVMDQDYPHKKMEIILIDSGSGDQTKRIMEQFREKNRDSFLDVLVADNPGRILSCGWNVAITRFTTDVIMRVDAHSHIPQSFVKSQVENLNRGEMVSGGMRPVIAEEESPWAATLLMAEESMFGSSVSSFRRKGERAYVKSIFHGAYRREVLERTGGFREDLGRTEDNEFHYRIRRQGYRLSMSPDIISYQYIRPNLRKMCRQKFGNGYWIGLTCGVCPGCLSLYYFVPWAFTAGILLTTVLCFAGFPWLSLVMWGAYWLLAAAMALLAVRGHKKNIRQFLLPILFFLLHMSYGIGTWAGLVRMPFWRGKHRECPSVERVREILRAKRNASQQAVSEEARDAGGQIGGDV